ECICGVSIIPGVFISMQALGEKTGLSVENALKTPKTAIGINTDQSIASGVVLGSAYCLDGMIEAFEKELGAACTVCATGGGARFIVPSCKKNIILNENLLLEGLYCYYKNSIM
ncbi:MAG: type III pantothenate kinase, partial [Oscillospiraceae bacterium]